MPATPFTAAPAPRRILAAVLTLGVLCGATTVMADTTDMVRDGIRACFANKEKVRAAKITRTALVLVGPVLAAEGYRDSALYDAAHEHVLRPRKKAAGAART